jgi:DNA-binding response OmpR family regulator
MNSRSPGSAASKSPLLVVDDDQETRGQRSLYLGEQDFDVATAEDRRAMKTWLAADTTGLVILDRMLPCFRGRPNYSAYSSDSHTKSQRRK